MFIPGYYAIKFRKKNEGQQLRRSFSTREGPPPSPKSGKSWFWWDLKSLSIWRLINIQCFLQVLIEPRWVSEYDSNYNYQSAWYYTVENKWYISRWHFPHQSEVQKEGMLARNPRIEDVYLFSTNDVITKSLATTHPAPCSPIVSGAPLMIFIYLTCA